MSLKRKVEDVEECQLTNTATINGLCPLGPHLVRGYFADRKGERDEMQDEHVIVDDISDLFPVHVCPEIRRIAYYAIFDGHGGSKASKYCAENLHKLISSKFPKYNNLMQIEQNLKRCFIESYKALDDEFLSEARKVKPVLKDGTTATAVLLLNNVAYVTNLGDSRAILCRYKENEKKEIALTLTVDHSPTLFEERMRIQKAGGVVKDGRIMGQLEVSRSFGDGQYKNHGLSCLPDVKRCTLTNGDRYILIACDGFWKTFSNQEALDFVSETKALLNKDDSLVGTKEKPLKDLKNELLCSKLAAEAVRKGSGDNVTVVLVTINADDQDQC